MADNDDNERRRGERVPINAEFAKLSAETTYVTDLSEHGVFVHTQELLPIGSKIELRFTVLLDDPVVIQGLGAVVRYQENPPGMGIEFGPLSPEMVLRIHDVVSRQRTRESGEPLPTAGSGSYSASDVAARSLTDAEFEHMATGRYPSLAAKDGPQTASSGEYELSATDLEVVDAKDSDDDGE